MTGGAPEQGFVLRDVVRETGLEESKIRFFERMFPEHFETAGAAARTFSAKQVAILRDLAELLPKHRNNLSAVRAELQKRHAAPTRALRVITVTSGKGGVGKTTVSINLALALARGGARTLLFDADLGLANVHVLAGLQPRNTIVELLQGTASIDEIVHDGPGGIRVICGGSGISGLADLKMDFVQFLGRELQRMGRIADVVVVDTAAGLTASVLHFIGLADDVVVVATPNLASTLDAYSLIKVARQEQIPGRIHLLVNQAADERQARHVREKICTCARKFIGFEPEAIGHLTRDPLMEAAVQRREPYLLAHPESDNARRFEEMAARLQPAPAPEIISTPTPELAATT
ncbi:MAG TPA: P-loop NTPase [Kiritimatiellia bacterium]|nr:P-loop NTPase [Kiritimatiellia bacterium]